MTADLDTLLIALYVLIDKARNRAIDQLKKLGYDVTVTER